MFDKLSLSSFFFLLCCLISNAQDVHLSQFYTAQLNLNPAAAGDYNGDYRIAGNYRNQWRQINDPITTVMLAFDKKIAFRGDELNAGIIVIQDQFAGFDLNTQKILLSSAYRKQIGYNNFSGGVQFGFTFKSTNLEGQTFPNQWIYETGVFDQTVSNEEAGLQREQSFFDVNLGGTWTRTFSKVRPTIGFALFHVNCPRDGFFDTRPENLRTRKVLHAEAAVKMKNDFSLSPKLLYMFTTKAQDMMLGGLLNKHLKETAVTSVYGGLLYRGGIDRNPDAIIPVIGLRTKAIDFGVSYDMTVSSLSGGSLKSTLEFSLVYTAPVFEATSLSIPCDRF